MACSMCAVSSTVHVMGPTWSSDQLSGSTPARLTRPYVGLRPTMPHDDAGPRMLPPVSDPSEPMHSPAATAAPEPLLDPPGMWSVFHGLRAGTNRLVGGPPRANSCIASLPSSTVPASRSRVTTVASCVGTRCSSTFDCAVVRTPAVSYRSFRAMGTPWSGPRYSPAWMARSAARASCSADSGRSVT